MHSSPLASWALQPNDLPNKGAGRGSLAVTPIIYAELRLGFEPRPDFFIGAHALVEGHTLLTRDARRYRSYFPGVRLIAPS